MPYFQNVARGKSKYGNRQKTIIESFVGLLETYAEHTEKLVTEKSDMLQVKIFKEKRKCDLKKFSRQKDGESIIYLLFLPENIVKKIRNSEPVEPVLYEKGWNTQI